MIVHSCLPPWRIALAAVFVLFLLAPPLSAEPADAPALPPTAPLTADAHTLLLLRGDRDAPLANAAPGAPDIEPLGIVFNVPGRFGEALAMRQWLGRIEAPHHDGFAAGPGRQLTVEFWMKAEGISHWRPFGMVLEKPNLVRIEYFRDRRGVGIRGSLRSEGGQVGSLSYVFPDGFDYGQWNHYAFVYGIDLGGNVPRAVLYVNGKPVNEGPVRGNPGTSDEPLTLFNVSNSRSHRWSRPFEGALDDVRISNIARYPVTADELKGINP